MKRLKIIILVSICLTGHLTQLVAQIQITKEQTDLIDRYLHLQQQSSGFSGTVMIAGNDSIIYRGSVGKASVEFNVQFCSDPGFQIASITKQLTAMLVVLAAKEQKLALSDQLFKYKPQLGQSDWSNITIRQLLTHTWGLPHNEGIEKYWEKI